MTHADTFAEAETLIDAPSSQVLESESQEQILRDFVSRCLTDSNAVPQKDDDAVQQSAVSHSMERTQVLPSVALDNTLRHEQKEDVARPGARRGSPSKRQRVASVGRPSVPQGVASPRKKQRPKPVPSNEEIDALFSQARPESSSSCENACLEQPVPDIPRPRPSNSTHSRATDRNRLGEILQKHKFIPYSQEEITQLCSVVASLLSDRFPRFPGLTWVFVRSNPLEVDECIDWCLSTPDSGIVGTLVDHWCSPDANAHDAAGVFGASCGRNRLIALGATLKRDMQAMMTDDSVCAAIRKDEVNRTGYTSAVYTARYSDALILKVSGDNFGIKLFHKSALGGETVNIKELATQLDQHLGRME